MQKVCVVINGQVINIGPWDYQYEQVEVTPSVVDEETNEVIREAEYQQVARNPLPEGALFETRDFEYDDVHGWFEVGIVKAPTLEERLAIAEQALLMMMEG